MTSLPDVKVAVRQYRKRMQPEQYFRDGKQYFALDRRGYPLKPSLYQANLSIYAIALD